jgi:hypothetical protein
MLTESLGRRLWRQLRTAARDPLCCMSAATSANDPRGFGGRRGTIEDGTRGIVRPSCGFGRPLGRSVRTCDVACHAKWQMRLIRWKAVCLAESADTQRQAVSHELFCRASSDLDRREHGQNCGTPARTWSQIHGLSLRRTRTQQARRWRVTGRKSPLSTLATSIQPKTPGS